MEINNQKHIIDIGHIEKLSSYSEILTYTSQSVPENIFLIEGQSSWNYNEFNKLVNQCCRYFQSIDLKPGDIISVVLKNSIDFLIVYFASIRSRIIINPFPYHLNSSEVIDKANHISPKLILCHDNHYKEISGNSYKIVNLNNFENNSFLEILDNYSSEDYNSSKINIDETAVLYYSSGTTGNPKIIQYSYRSMLLTQLSMYRAEFIESKSIHLCVLPLGHTASLRYTIKPCILTGSTVILYESFWKLRPKLWDEIEKYKATFIEVVPSILIAIMNTPYKNFRKEQVKSMDFIGCGSAFLAQNLQEAFEEKYKIPVANLYGLSETGATHFDNPRLPDRVTGNIGKPFDIVDVKIFDDNSSEVHAGEIGEIAMKGLSLFKGYYKNNELTKNSFKNGYFLTGDLGKMDNKGLYYYADRKKDLIIKGGINIIPAQIDEIYLQHPSIVEVATIGKPDMFLGETIKSYIILKKDTQIDKNDLKQHCRDHLGDFKTPSEIEFVDVLPKGPSGKILKRKLRQQEINKLI